MTAELAIVLALLAAAIVMFAVGRPRMDAVALLMLTLLPFTGVLTMSEALAGFADANVVLIATLFVIGEGLLRTGVVQKMGDLLMAKAGKSEQRLVVLLMLFVGTLGAVMSSTGVVAIFIPVVLRVAQMTGAVPSGLMMPLSVAALSSGMITLVATAPNLVVNSELVRHGLDGFHFFSFTPIGVLVLFMSTAYMLVARKWLEDRSGSEPRRAARPSLPDWVEKYGLAERELRVRVTDGSPLVGVTAEDSGLAGRCGATLLAIERAQPRGVEILDPAAKPLLRSGDVLLVDLYDRNCDSAALATAFGLEILPLSGAFFKDRTQDLGMSEALIGPDSSLVGRTVKQIGFRTRFQVSVLGLRHGSTPQPHGHLQEPLRVGDTLLLFGPWKRIDALRHGSESHDLVLLGTPTERDEVLAAPGKAGHALAVLALVVGLMVTGVVPNVQAGLIGVLLLGVLGCVDFSSAYNSIHWKSLVLIAGMMPFSLALQRTGGVDLAADALVALSGGAGPHALLAALFAITAMIGLFVSNTATAVLMAPVAIAVANELGSSPYPFAMTVAVAASTAFMTPVSSPVNTLVVGPGNYVLGDFVKVGVPLSIMVLVLAVLMIPILFPF
jgi:di/tricarboxylate transporter